MDFVDSMSPSNPLKIGTVGPTKDSHAYITAFGERITKRLDAYVEAFWDMRSISTFQ
jgi:hypothetical protein